MQVAALLEASARRGDDSKRIKVKLGALLAKDIEHQKRLYRLFDQYLEQHSWQFVPTKEKPPENSRLRIWWERNGLALSLGLIGLTLMLLIGRWYTYNYLVDLQSSANAPQINHLNGWVHLSHNSSIRQFPPFVSDSIKETRWIWGDGSEDSFGDHVIHQFSDLNQSYEVIFYQELGNGKRDTGKVNIAFKNPAEVRIMPDIDNFSVGLETTYLFPDNMRGAIEMNPGLKNQLDSLNDKLELSWDLGDGSLDSGLSVSHRYRDSGNYTILVKSRLKEDIGALKQGLTFTDSISVKVPLRKNLSLIPVSKIDIKPPNINDLVKVDNSYWLFLVLSLIALGIYALYEYLIWRRRRAVLEGSADKLPPLRQKLRIEMPELNLYGNAYFGRITTLLRKRRDSEVLDLNLAKSLQESLKQGGEYPIFAYSTRQQASQYLVLIEERNRKDHLARFYESLIKELNQRDITAEYFFYDHDPSLCWKQRSQPTTEVPLSQLLSTFAGYRLIIIGSGKGMLDPRTGELEDFVHMMDEFPEKALLSTIPNEKWGRSERELSTYFSLLPATEEGWEEMVPQWQLESLPDPTYWKGEQYEFAPPALDSENLIPELRLYLGEKRFQWLCACAVYPVLYYELTLQLGSLITEEEIGLEALGHLFRLDWFRKGSIPEEIRLELVAQLRPNFAKQTRKYLIEILNANPAPQGSLAEQDQQTTLAIYQYLNSGRRKEDLEELQESLKNLDPEDLEDLLSVKYLSDIKHDPLIIPLPKSFYRGGISIMGTQWKARLALVLAALLAILAFIGFQDVQDLQKKAAPRYDNKDLNLFSEQDQARWHHYNAVMLEKEGDYSAASESYQTAIQYDIYATVQKDTFVKHVWQHRFNWAWEHYQKKDFEMAQAYLDSTSFSLLRFNSLRKEREEEKPDSLLWKLMRLIKKGNPDTIYSPPIFISYLSGINRLQNNKEDADNFLRVSFDGLAVVDLNRMDRGFYQDSSRNNVFSQEDSAKILLLDHLQASSISPSEPNLVELLEKLGQPSFTYRLSIKTGSLTGSNTDQEEINFRLLGSDNLITARLDSPFTFSGLEKFERGQKDVWKLNSAVPIGAIERIGISLGTEESSSLDDWYIDSLILETPDGHGPYRIAVKTWIGDDKKSRYNTPR
ncbi:MAG: PKD domain-containing protein, partial [Bacteroidota bacterium]